MNEGMSDSHALASSKRMPMRMLARAETHLREQERNTDKLADARVKTRRVTGLGTRNDEQFRQKDGVYVIFLAE
jgi:hypothetical protein